MPLDPNNKLLVDSLEACPLLDNRYENIRLVNYDSVADERRGCLSMVFRAFDRLSGKDVALKFYDISPVRMHDRYRRAAFVREHELLETLLTVDRCLQLVSELSEYQLVIPHHGLSITIPCTYFAVEWIDDGIDAFFFNAHRFDALDKLRLFNEIVLAVGALHNHEIFHRDLKADNLRSYKDALKRVVVAIDLGTAARLDSGHIQVGYGQHVGARGYASPEAIGGLTANRLVATYTDVYALGCLLFELFNMDYFYNAVRRKNINYDTVIAAISSRVLSSSDEDRKTEWCSSLKRLGLGFAPVSILEHGSSVPLGVASILDDVLASLTNFDFQNRPTSLEWVRKRIWSAIKALENERAYQSKLVRAKESRLLRREKALAKDKRNTNRRIV